MPDGQNNLFDIRAPFKCKLPLGASATKLAIRTEPQLTLRIPT